MKLLDEIFLFYVFNIKKIRAISIKFLVWLFFVKSTNVKKILVNRDGAFGDSVVALPALSIIRQNFPHAQIDLLTFSNSGITFNDFNLEHKLIINLFVKNKAERSKTIQNLRKENYDFFIQLPQNLGLYKSIRNMLIVRFVLKIKYAFGWDHGRIKSFIKTQKQAAKKSCLSSNKSYYPTETMRLVNILKTHGLKGEIVYPVKKIIPIDKTLIDLLNNELIAFIIGSKLMKKKWSLDNWVALSNLIGNKNKIIIIGGETELDEAEYIHLKTSNTYNFCNKLSISELFYVFQNISLAVSHDTGAMHVCDAVSTKIIGLFSSKELTTKWYPNTKNSVVIENDISMANIDTGRVYEEVKKIMY